MRNVSLPIVALVGRPNVGKSTLFNRLLHKRRAITDPAPGVTRDPVEADCVIEGKHIRLIDSGGYKLQDTGIIDDLVIEKTLESIRRADLIVLLLDAGEITTEDEEFINVLRPYQEKLIAAVNKTEGGRQEAAAWNLLSYGFKKIFMISAEHGDNVADLAHEITGRLDFSAADTTQVQLTEEDYKPVRIALLGKPNTGKSTLSNRLTSTNASIVSDIPGTTRDVVEGSFTWKPAGRGASHDFIILDTAGIRRKSKVSDNVEYYSVNRAIKTINNADIIVLLIDAQEGLSEQDKKIAALAHDKGRGIIIALNKWDTMPQVKNAFEAACDRIHFLFAKMEYAPIIALSAKDGYGTDKLLSTVIAMYKQLNTTIETSRLNQSLSRWLEEHPPPSGPNTRFNVKYAVQSSANPVEFLFFCSRTHAVNETYMSYLKNRIRKDLGFSSIPVSVQIRSSAKKKS